MRSGWVLLGDQYGNPQKWVWVTNLNAYDVASILAAGRAHKIRHLTPRQRRRVTKRLHKAGMLCHHGIDWALS